jgi:hypothetical protein
LNFGVIGEPCVDYIYRDGKEMQEKLGGILYAVTGLSLICGEEHNVYPIMNLGSDKYDYITSFLKKLKNIHFDFVNKVDGNVRIVKLFYKNRNDINSEANSDSLQTLKKTYDREECSTEPIKPIEYNFIKDAFKHLDALLINMISGVDITLETLKNIRNNFTGYIHLDVHNIVMNTDTDGNRKQGPVTGWYDWLINCDTFQMNETEASVITPEKLGEYDIADKILSVDNTGPKAMIITRGHDGISLLTKKSNKNNDEVYYDIDRRDEAAIENNKFKDSTGCGDIFGAGFFFRNSITQPKDYSSAMLYANKLASNKTEHTGVEEMVKMN